ncbi:MAG: FecR domain-containing protein [Ginsengibacter sp.]
MPSQSITSRFNQLIDKYLTGEATPEEAAFIKKYYQYFEENPDTTLSLSDEEIDLIAYRMLEKLRMNMDRPKAIPVIPIQNKRNFRWVAAAILFVILSTGTFFLLNGKKPLSAETNIANISVKHDVAPGGKKAMITLGDGSQIELDSSQNGTISQQGNMKVIKLSNGEIVYKPKGGNANSEVLINKLTTPIGGQYQLTLADGTKVWMNSASSISYPTAFIGSERQVKITGEVYFEVAKNAKQPFRVIINDHTEISVLGTHFNVNAYDDKGAAMVTLLEGSVQVKNNNEVQMLKPGQQAETNEAIKVINNVNIDLIMAWKNGYFSFDNTRLQMVMNQLTRWYDVDVVYEDNVPDMKFWGSINMNSTLSQVLKILEESGVYFKIENKKIIVLSKKNIYKE